MCFHWLLKIRNWKQPFACFQFPSQIEFWKQFLFSARFELSNKFFSLKNKKLFLKIENKGKKQLPNIPLFFSLFFLFSFSNLWYALCRYAWGSFLNIHLYYLSKKKKNLGNKDVPLSDNHSGSSFVNHTLPWEYIKQNIMWQEKLTTLGGEKIYCSLALHV